MARHIGRRIATMLMVVSLVAIGLGGCVPFPVFEGGHHGWHEHGRR